MKRFKLIKLSALLLLITAFNFYGIVNTYAGDNKGRVVSGKVVYSDDKSPVKGGIIKVIRISTTTVTETIVENVVINSNGQFSIANIIPATTDIIKIMCYPNDREDSFGFTPQEVNLNSLIANSANEKSLIIKVQRTNNKNSRELK